MLRQLFLVLGFAFLFGLGQQGAATHAIKHLADWQKQQQDQAPHNPHCEECAVYASLASALPGQTLALAAVSPAFEPHVAIVNGILSSGRHSYSARAPPFLA